LLTKDSHLRSFEVNDFRRGRNGDFIMHETMVFIISNESEIDPNLNKCMEFKIKDQIAIHKVKYEVFDAVISWM
jgi:hypothetical protein